MQSSGFDLQHWKGEKIREKSDGWQQKAVLDMVIVPVQKPVWCIVTSVQQSFQLWLETQLKEV